jgi:sarcosine oxidase subunit delta
MRIPCPYCGAREHGEFTYLGDASLMQRPDPSADDAAQQFHEYQHLRANPAGEHRELWYHDGGCRSWLVVTRNTITHVIAAVERAEEVRL